MSKIKKVLIALLLSLVLISQFTVSVLAANDPPTQHNDGGGGGSGSGGSSGGNGNSGGSGGGRGGGHTDLLN